LAKTSLVLRALKILGLEEILKLSEVIHSKQALKKAAGAEELILWDDAPKPVSKPELAAEPVASEGRVLNFRRPEMLSNHFLSPPPAADPAPGEHLSGTDLMLWQRSMHREASPEQQKRDAFSGYNKLNEMYLVKSDEPAPEKKLRFAATQGVLINKRQA
jgi:hypothetical protein